MLRLFYSPGSRALASHIALERVRTTRWRDRFLEKRAALARLPEARPGGAGAGFGHQADVLAAAWQCGVCDEIGNGRAYEDAEDNKSHSAIARASVRGAHAAVVALSVLRSTVYRSNPPAGASQRRAATPGGDKPYRKLNSPMRKIAAGLLAGLELAGC
jgi:hypothetical protein